MKPAWEFTISCLNHPDKHTFIRNLMVSKKLPAWIATARALLGAMRLVCDKMYFIGPSVVSHCSLAIYLDKLYLDLVQVKIQKGLISMPEHHFPNSLHEIPLLKDFIMILLVGTILSGAGNMKVHPLACCNAAHLPIRPKIGYLVQEISTGFTAEGSKSSPWQRLHLIKTWL